MINLVRKRYSKNPYHIVEASPWPLFTSINLLGLMLTLVLTSHKYIGNINILTINIILLISSISLWVRDIISESTYLGLHTKIVKRGLNLGFILFIVSELLFFIGIFWAYFHSSLSPNIEIGSIWPPYGIKTIDPLGLPLYNTILLLSSGATITFSHHYLLSNNIKLSILGMILTILIMLIFTLCQYFEYIYSPFTISDGILGSTFYIGTGLHGLHIIVGIIMLFIALWRISSYHWTLKHHIGLSTSILYVHFLDIVWLFLFLVFYWWGS